MVIMKNNIIYFGIGTIKKALNSSLFNLGSPFLFLRDYYHNLYSWPIADHFGLFFSTIVHILS